MANGASNRDRKNMGSVAPGARSPDLSVHGRTLFPLPLKRRYQEKKRQEQQKQEEQVDVVKGGYRGGRMS